MVPQKGDRIPITLRTAIQPLLCYVPYLYLCYLSRRQNTFLIRLLIFPLVVLCVFTAAYRYTWTHPALYVYNWGQSFFGLVAVARAFDMGLSPQGMVKYGETRPGVSKGKQSTKANGHYPRSNGDCSDDDNAASSSGLADALDLALTFRGLSYKFGEGAIFLPPTFAAAPWARYAVSTFIHLLTGSALMAGFHMVYDLIVIVAVGLLNSSPASWPPLMENPFAADSMHSFWGRRWHQLLRRPLVVLGGIPASWIAGDVGMLCGTFIASGLFHEGSMYAMDRGLDLGGFLFFVIQGPILILERVWRQAGLWVYTVIFILGQPLTDSWHRRGLGGGMVIPPFFSPTRLLLIPLVQRLLNQH
ncbi:membrane bound O-acyl transferase family-domain-containing protein [Amanita rubescens]|nr:membrane bound O-acyl transferase family-domain-containing protein [Amanita rubescens]